MCFSDLPTNMHLLQDRTVAVFSQKVKAFGQVEEELLLPRVYPKCLQLRAPNSLDYFQTLEVGFQTKLPSAFCWCSVVSRCIGCRASLPIVHFKCTPHKKQKHPLGRQSVSLSLSNRHIQAHSISHNQSRLNTQMHTQTFSPCFPYLHRHTPEEQYLNLLFVLETEQRYSSDWSKMCFLASISNSNVSNELEEKTSDRKQLGISK